LNIDLDLTANTTGLGMLSHEVVKLLNSIVIRARSNIEKKRHLRLKIFADTLEEPSM
jgi:hypothetical protein